MSSLIKNTPRLADLAPQPLPKHLVINQVCVYSMSTVYKHYCVLHNIILQNIYIICIMHAIFKGTKSCVTCNKGDLFAHFHLVFVSTSIINTLQHIFKSSAFSVKEQS